jgi:hypothetical protein
MGPGSTDQVDALDCDWPRFFDYDVRAFLNPGFANMPPWVAKCIEAAKAKRRITLVCLPSLETQWARDAIKHADVYHLWPRVPFIDEEHPEKKRNNRNTMILDFNGNDRRRPPCLWNWKTNETTEFAP